MYLKQIRTQIRTTSLYHILTPTKLHYYAPIPKTEEKKEQSEMIESQWVKAGKHQTIEPCIKASQALFDCNVARNRPDGVLWPEAVSLAGSGCSMSCD